MVDGFPQVVTGSGAGGKENADISDADIDSICPARNGGTYFEMSTLTGSTTM